MSAPLRAARPGRRGACPGLSAPMATGDGLLARLAPVGTMSLDAFAGLCAAARMHGNGIIEITARGSIQARGLDASSAAEFAAAIGALGIAASDGVPVIADPLAGLDPSEVIDAGALAGELRARIATAPFGAKLAPKLSIAVDGGGALHLDALYADVRLRARAQPQGARLFVAVAGTAATATPIGAIAPGCAGEAVLHLLALIASEGVAARAEDVVRRTGENAFRSAIADLLIDTASSPMRSPAEPIGRHRLRDETAAIGIGLPFGHAQADLLERVAETAQAVEADGVRTAPGRALLLVGIEPDREAALAAACERLGCITRANDRRRYVAACAGAPTCAAAEMSARAIAHEIAAAAAPLLDGSLMLHLSGCPKGCAHRGAAALTLVGSPDGYGVVLDGDARGAAQTHVPAEMLPASLAGLARAVESTRRPRERATDALARLGAMSVAAILAEAVDD